MYKMAHIFVITVVEHCKHQVVSRISKLHPPVRAMVDYVAVSVER